MYRLLGFNSVNKARLALNRRNLFESRNQNVNLLFNRKPCFLALPGKFNARELMEYHPVISFNSLLWSDNAKIGGKTWNLTLHCDCFLVLAGFYQKNFSSSELGTERVNLLTKKKRKKFKRYTELLQGKQIDCVRKIVKHHKFF